MAKYVAIRNLRRAKSHYEYEEERLSATTISVIVDDDAPIETGLLNQDGTPLYRLTERGAWGYVPVCEHY